MLAEVQTMKEAGLADIQALTWNGLVAPAGTSAVIIQTLNASVNEALRSPSIAVMLATFLLQADLWKSQGLRGIVASEARKWRDAIRQAGVQAE